MIAEFAILVNLLRIPIFLFIGIESLATFFLYRYGYYKYKPSEIIRVLSLMFLYIGIEMIYQAFLPFALVFNPQVHTVLVMLLPLALIPIYIFIRSFRIASVRGEGEKLRIKKVRK
jgi:hypothetical protein